MTISFCWLLNKYFSKEVCCWSNIVSPKDTVYRGIMLSIVRRNFVIGSRPPGVFPRGIRQSCQSSLSFHLRHSFIFIASYDSYIIIHYAHAMGDSIIQALAVRLHQLPSLLYTVPEVRPFLDSLNYF